MKRLTAAEKYANEFQPRPTWAHPANEAHQAAYVRAVNWLRRGKRSRWLLDKGAAKPKWAALPDGEEVAA